MLIGEAKYFRLVVFHKGKRIEKRVHRKSLPKLVSMYQDLKSQGVKCHIVGMTENRLFPPVRSIRENLEEGRLWCPYCGAWRYFNVPRAYLHAEFGSREWYMNVYRNNETRCCAWCDMPIKDYYICRVNGIYEEVWGAARRRRRKPGVRKRVSRRAS